MLLGDVVDQLHDDDRLTHPRATEEADLSAALIRGKQVDDLDARLESLDLRLLFGEGGGVAVDRVALGGGYRSLLVDRFSHHVHDAPERRLADRDGDDVAGVANVLPAYQAVRRVHGNRAHRLLTEVQRHLHDEVPRLGADRRVGNLEGAVDRRQVAVDKLHVDDGSDHLCDASGVGHVSRLILSGLRRPRRSPSAPW